MSNRGSLLNFSDSLILKIVKLFSPVETVNFAHTSVRLYNLCKDESIWENVCVSSPPTSLSDVYRIVKYCPGMRRLNLPDIEDVPEHSRQLLGVISRAPNATTVCHGPPSQFLPSHDLMDYFTDLFDM